MRIARSQPVPAPEVEEESSSSSSSSAAAEATPSQAFLVSKDTSPSLG